MPSGDKQKKIPKQKYPEHLIIQPDASATLHGRIEVWAIVLVVFGVVAFAGARWYAGRERERAVAEMRARAELERRQALAAGRVSEEAPVLGQVAAVASDFIDVRSRGAPLGAKRTIRFFTPAGTAFSFHFRDSSRRPAEIGRSEIRRGQFVVVETEEPVGLLGIRSAAEAKSVSVLE